jgi:hypothetical protein
MRARVGPPLVLFAVALGVTAILPAVFGPGVLAAGIPSPACGSLSPADAARAAVGGPTERGKSAKVRPTLSKRGELTGRSLSFELPFRSVSIALPLESSVSEAFGDTVLVTRAVAGGSEVRAVNLVSGCDVRLVGMADIARGATVDSTDSALYVHSVSKAGRADAGVTRYDLATGASELVVPALKPVAQIGPIFGTDLRWSLDGAALAVQSCGVRSCLTRVLDITSRDVATYAGRGQGAFIGLTSRHLVTFGTCPGLPCSVASTDLATGSVEVVAEEAFDATVTPTQDGAALLTIDTAAGNLEFAQ